MSPVSFVDGETLAVEVGLSEEGESERVQDHRTVSVIQAEILDQVPDWLVRPEFLPACNIPECHRWPRIDRRGFRGIASTIERGASAGGLIGTGRTSVSELSFQRFADQNDIIRYFKSGHQLVIHECHQFCNI